MTIDEIAKLEVGAKVVFKFKHSYNKSVIHVGALFRFEGVMPLFVGTEDIYKFAILTRRCETPQCIYCAKGVWISSRTSTNILSNMKVVNL